MPDTPAKRQREAQKRRNREIKAERKRLRKEGLLGNDNSGLFAPGEPRREVVPHTPAPKTPPPGEAPPPEAAEPKPEN